MKVDITNAIGGFGSYLRFVKLCVWTAYGMVATTWLLLVVITINLILGR